MAVYSIILDWIQQVEASVIVIYCSETVTLTFFFVQNLKGTEQYVSKVFVSEGARLHILFMSFWRRWKAACIIGGKQTCWVMVLDKVAVDLSTVAFHFSNCKDYNIFTSQW